MPKITIKERDYTTPGIGNYENFDVLVPGFVAANKGIDPETGDDIFDSNGIYRFTNQSDFEKLIGFVEPGQEAQKRAFAVATSLSDAEWIAGGDGRTQTIPGFSKHLTSLDFYGKYFGKAYAFTALENAPDADKGKRILKATFKESGAENETDHYYTLKLIVETIETGKEAEQVAFVAGMEGVVLLSEGTDASEASTTLHYGNEIAYMLLGLGYSVLYKKLESISSLNDDESYWGPLADKANYDFRFIVNGKLTDNTLANEAIYALAAARGDCTALMDVDETVYDTPETLSQKLAKITEKVNGHTLNSNETAGQYGAFFTPSVCYDITFKEINGVPYYKNKKFPATFHYLACFARSVFVNNNAEWFAPAGLVRGVSSFTVTRGEIKFGEIAVNKLEPRFIPESAGTDGLKHAVNIVECVRNNYYLWGNRTAYELGVENSTAGELVASHFLNVRQLCSTLKKQIYVTCRRFTFDPNSDVLWFNFCNAIKPTLEAMKANQGIDDYEIIKVATNLKATLKARIRIVPIEAVEDFDIEVSLEDSLGETSVTVSE